MGKLMKKYLLVLLAGFALVEVVYAASTKFTDLQCRNLTVTGTSAVTGAETHTGAQTYNGGASFVGATPVGVSSTTASTDKLYFAGAFVTLPTSGYSRGTLAVQTSNMKLYLSTETVATSGSWQSVGSQ